MEAQGEKFCTSYDPNSLLYVSKVGRCHGVCIHLRSGLLLVPDTAAEVPTLSVTTVCCYVYILPFLVNLSPSCLLACSCLHGNE